MSGRGTPATVAATKAKIAFRVHEYEHDPASASYGEEAAVALGVDPARVQKTLVAVVEVGSLSTLVVAVVPVAGTLDLKALAGTAGAKRAQMAEPGAVERATGYVLGGISPLGQRKSLPTYIDSGAIGHATVFVSAGRRGLEIELSPADLVRLTRAAVASIAKPPVIER